MNRSEKFKENTTCLWRHFNIV